jgi:hypothetical protein
MELSSVSSVLRITAVEPEIDAHTEQNGIDPDLRSIGGTVHYSTDRWQTFDVAEVRDLGGGRGPGAILPGVPPKTPVVYAAEITLAQRKDPIHTVRTLPPKWFNRNGDDYEGTTELGQLPGCYRQN